MKFSVLAVFALALDAVAASDASKPCAHKVKEAVGHPKLWKKIGVPSAAHTITLGIALPQPNFNELEQHLIEISDPDHDRYGAHLTHDEVNELVAPHPESLDAVTKWLASHGLGESDVTRSPANDWAHITVPLSKVEVMLNTTYHVWEHVPTGETLVRTMEYSLPEDIHEHIELIQPTTMFARWKGMKATLYTGDEQEGKVEFANAKVDVHADTPPVDASCNATVTPKCLRQVYNAVGYTPQVPKKGGIGISSYLEQYINNADLQNFYARHVPEAVGSNYTFISVDGGLNSQNGSEAGVEAALDAQYAFGLTYPIKETAWSTGGSPPWNPTPHTPENTNEPYNAWLDEVLKAKSLPHVISTSYGEEELSIPISYGKRACSGFAQLGVKGVSVLFSSGDGGVGDGEPDPAFQVCYSEVNGKNVTKFLPSFPASCPFVTAVGGTNDIPEKAVFFSGGGFSDWFERPWYQEKAVPEYLKKLPKGVYKGLYNPKGRGIPDVAALGRRYQIVVNNATGLIGGTSASAPTFAAFTALLNDARLAKGKPTLGFLNPMLYSKGYKGLNDIADGGSNPGCGTPGFNTTEGWDPVTGLGTPNFGKLLKITA